MSDLFARIADELTGRKPRRVIGADSPVAATVKQIQTDAAAWQAAVANAPPPLPTLQQPGGYGGGGGSTGGGALIPNPNNPGYYTNGTPDTVDPSVPNAQGQMVPNPNYSGATGGATGGGGGDSGGSFSPGGDSGGGDPGFDDGGSGSAPDGVVPDDGGGDGSGGAPSTDAAAFSAQADAADQVDQPTGVSQMNQADQTTDMSSDDLFSDVMGELTGKTKKRRSALVGAEVENKTYGDYETVIAVQRALIAKGFDLGTSGASHNGADGVMGTKTLKALRLMQVAQNMPETGVIDDTTLLALKVPPPRPVQNIQLVRKPQSDVPASPSTSWIDFFYRPLWTGSRIKIWEGAIGAGVAVALSSILLATTNKRKKR